MVSLWAAASIRSKGSPLKAGLRAVPVINEENTEPIPTPAPNNERCLANDEDGCYKFAKFERTSQPQASSSSTDCFAMYNDSGCYSFSYYSSALRCAANRTWCKVAPSAFENEAVVWNGLPR